MARATNVVPSWKHRSVYWRTIVNRQFIDNNEIFVYVKNHGITEVFCLGRPCLTIHRLQKGTYYFFLKNCKEEEISRLAWIWVAFQSKKDSLCAHGACQ